MMPNEIPTTRCDGCRKQQQGMEWFKDIKGKWLCKKCQEEEEE